MGRNSDAMTGTSLMRLKDVIQRTGLSRSAIYRKVQSNDFPKSVKLGDRMVAWHSREIDQWIAKRIADRNSSSRPKRPVRGKAS